MVLIIITYVFYIYKNLKIKLLNIIITMNNLDIFKNLFILIYLWIAIIYMQIKFDKI